MPRTGCCVYRRAWPTRHGLEMAVFSCTEGFYNTCRRRSRLDNLSRTALESKIRQQMTRHDTFP